MDLADCKPVWEPGLDGGVVCVGYKSSRLSKAEMSDVIEAIYSYAAKHGVELKDA
jgi:thiamine monophosphate synthase